MKTGIINGASFPINIDFLSVRTFQVKRISCPSSLKPPHFVPINSLQDPFRPRQIEFTRFFEKLLIAAGLLIGQDSEVIDDVVGD